MKYILGIDTSNYTTSVALIDQDHNIIEDRRRSIKVKEGMKGIRQSEALFQHIDNLPDLIEGLPGKYGDSIDAVCVSSRPRPVKGSYMPVFKAGMNSARLISDALGSVLIKTSHQEGHIEAGKYIYGGGYRPDLISDDGLAVFHLSGGTTEILFENRIIGGSKDISFGQLLDRMGAYSGYSFPAGRELDEIAVKRLKKEGSYEKIKSQTFDSFKNISKTGLEINLSGLDSQVKRIMKDINDPGEKESIISSVFYLISLCLETLTTELKKQYNVENVLYVGGVSSSTFIRDHITKSMEKGEPKVLFGAPELSVDNAVGVAIVGGKEIWQ